ncbi:MAG: serine/threonine protein kinase [Firmicutes bacterium]|nr:serine/threonine protein kinase [Bacillota bacterium]
MLHQRYNLFEVIGQGRSGVVRRGYDHVLQREVAVKTMADTPQARWEVQVLASLKHPHIVEFYDVVIQGGKIHLVMELGLGGTARDRCLTLAELIEVGQQAGEALHYLHQQGLVHCDIKPSHLAFSHAGTVKLVDFGTCAVVGGQAVGGTARFMAPEVKSEPCAHPRLDVFGLGKTLLVLAKANRIGLPRRLKSCFSLAASAAPEHRFQKMGEFLAVLDTGAGPGRKPYWRGAAAALLTLGLLVFGTAQEVYPALFTVLLGPGIVGWSALYSPLLALIALAVVIWPCLLI